MLTDKELEEIRRKMLELEAEPPSDAWNRIKVEVQPPGNKWRPNGWFALVLLLLISMMATLYFVGHPALNTKAVDNIAVQEREENKAPLAQRGDKINQLKQASEKPAAVPAGAVSTVAPDQYNTDGNLAEEKMHQKEEPMEQVPELPQSSQLPEQSSETVAFPVVAEGEEEELESTYKKTNVAAIKATAPNKILLHDRLERVVPVLLPDKALVIPDAESLTLPSVGNTSHRPAVDKSYGKEKPGKEWYLGLTVAPRYAFRSFSPATADEVYIINLSSRKRLDTERLGYEYALSAGNKISEQLYLETSLSLMQLRENVSYSYTAGQIDTVLKSTASDGSLILTPKYKVSERELKSVYAYGGLRVGLTYFFLERAKSRLNVTVAAGANLLVKGRTTEYADGEWSETIIFPSKDNILEQSNYNLLIGAGYNLRVRSKYELMMMPSLSYFLGSTFHEREPFGLRPYTLGVSLQVRRSFNRQ